MIAGIYADGALQPPRREGGTDTLQRTDIDIVDGYLHCGRTKYRPVAEVRSVLERAGVGRAVLVQHLGEYDNSYIGGIAAASPDMFAGVFLVDISSPRRVEQMSALAASGHFKGIRLTAESLVTAPDLWHEACLRRLIIVLYAPTGLLGHVAPLRDFLEGHRDCRLVITHLGNPDVRHAPTFEGYDVVLDLARYPGVHFQLSGIKMFCPHPHRELHPFVRSAAQRFGPSRLIWGSNYPVVGELADYLADLRLVTDNVLSLPGEWVADILGGNARRLWFSPPSTTATRDSTAGG